MRTQVTIPIVLVSFVLAASSYASVGTPPMPEAHSLNGFTYLTGGVGQWERDQIDSRADQYDLKLIFAERTGAYLGDVDVTIAKPDADVMLHAKSDGPWFLAALPDGDYDVRVTDRGETFERHVDVKNGQLATASFSWPEAARSTIDRTIAE